MLTFYVQVIDQQKRDIPVAPNTQTESFTETLTPVEVMSYFSSGVVVMCSCSGIACLSVPKGWAEVYTVMFEEK